MSLVSSHKPKSQKPILQKTGIDVKPKYSKNFQMKLLSIADIKSNLWNLSWLIMTTSSTMA